MPTIKTWNGFSKRRNSTKQPSQAGTDIAVKLKEDTSIENPVFILQGDQFNIDYVQAFGAYYFVSNIISLANGLTELHCEKDPLATYKSQIGSTSAFVEFTSTSSNIIMTDPRNIPSNTFAEKTSTLLDLENYRFASAGCFILGVAGGLGGVTYYAMDALTLQQVFNKVYDTTFVSQIENQFFDIKSCIASCILIPATPSALTNSDPVIIAGQSIGVDADIVSRYTDIPETSYDIQFPFGDGIWSEGSENYVDYAYSVGTLYLPFVGVVPLDIGVVAKSRQIRIGASVDWCTGAIVYKIANASGDFMNTYQGNFAANVPVVSESFNAMGVASGILGMIGGGVAAATGHIAGASAAMYGGAQQTLQNLSLHTQVNGSISSLIGNRLGRQVTATVVTKMPSEPDLRQFQAVLGMPFYQVSLINALSGYVKCVGASVSISGESVDRDAINSFLNGGFFYE